MPHRIGGIAGGSNGVGLPAGVYSTEQFNDIAGIPLHDCTTTTGWSSGTVDNTYGFPTILEGIAPASSTPKFLVNLPSNVSTTGFSRLVFKVRWEGYSGFPNSDSLSTWFTIKVATGTNFSGTVLSMPYPQIPSRQFASIVIDITSLPSVRSIGVQSDGGQTVAGGQGVAFNIAALRFANQTAVDQALDTGATSAVLISPTYIPTLSQDPRTPDRERTVIDLRAGSRHISGLNNVRYLREWEVPNDGTDATAALIKATAELGNGETLMFPAGAAFNVDGAWTVLSKKNVTIDLNGSVIYTKRWRGGDNNVGDPIVTIFDCYSTTFRNGAVYGYRDSTFNGSTLLNDGGSAAVVGSTKTLTAQSTGVVVDTGNYYSRGPLAQFPADVQPLIAAFDPTFQVGHAFTATLSDSNQVARDAILEVIPTDVVHATTTLTAATTSTASGILNLTVASTTGWLTGDKFFIDGELMSVSSINSSTSMNASRDYGPFETHASGSPLVYVFAGRSITLTATPTKYVLPYTPADRRRHFKFRIRKAKATTNTISVTSMTIFGVFGYSGTHDSASALTAGRCKELLIEDMLVEGAATDGFECSERDNNGVTLRRCVSLKSSRQGMSFNRGENYIIEDFEIGECGRSGIDVEPYDFDWFVRGIDIRRGKVYNCVNYIFALGNWANIFNLHVSDIEAAGSGVGFLGGGGHDSSFTNLYYAFLPTTLQNRRSASVNFVGGNMRCTNITTPGNLNLGSGVITTFDGVAYGTDNNVVSGVTLTSNGFVTLGGGVGNRIEGVRSGAELLIGANSSTALFGRTTPSTQQGSYAEIRSLESNQWPATFKGALASDLPFVRGGTNLWDEPALGVRAVSSARATVPLMASTVVTTAGTTTGVDLGARGRHGMVRIWANAVSGTPSVAATVQVSQDNSHWYDVDTLAPLTAAYQNRSLKLTYLERYMRLSYAITGTTSVTMQAAVDLVGPAGVNLGQAGVAVTASATSKAVIFPGSRLGPVFSSAGGAGTTATGGMLSPSTTYYYRVGARSRDVGPVLWHAETAMAFGASHNAAFVTAARWMTSSPEGVLVDGLTILRGTSPGVYSTRYDILPKVGILTSAGRADGTGWVDLGGSVVTDGNFLTGFPDATYPTAGGPYTAIDESGFEPDANYSVVITPSWNTTYWVTAKTPGGFTANFGTAAPGGGGTFDYVIVR